MDIGRFLIIIGILLIALGVGLTLGARLFSWFGNLPGDIRIIKENYKIFFPITSMIILSIGFILLTNGIIWVIKLFTK